MPNNNGRIYRTSTLGVSVADVQAVLGQSSGDVDTLCSYYGLGTLAEEYKPYGINKWATFKPMIAPAVTPLALSEIYNHQFGLSLLSNQVTTKTLPVLLDELANISASSVPQSLIPYYYDLCAYTPPSGGTISTLGIDGSPYRLSDYAYRGNIANGYDHSATPRFSYKVNSTWHSIVVRYGGFDKVVSIPVADEDLSSETDWVNWSGASLLYANDADLTLTHNSILIHDLLGSMYNSQQGLSTWKKGYVFMVSNGDGEVFVCVGQIPWVSNDDFIAMLNQGSTIYTLEFLTDAQVGTYTYSNPLPQGSNWVILPYSIGSMTISGGSGVDFSGQITADGAWNPYLRRYDLAAQINRIDWSTCYYGGTEGNYYIKLVLGELPTSTSSVSGNDVLVYQTNVTSYPYVVEFPSTDSTLEGQTLYLNFVGKRNSSDVILGHYEVNPRDYSSI